MPKPPVAVALLFSFALLGALAHSRDAAAFCRTRTIQSRVDDCQSKGPSLFWKNRCVGFVVATAASKKANLDKARTIVNAAFATWTSPNAVCTPGVRALEQAPSSANDIGFDRNGTNENIFVFRDDVWPYDDAGNPLALTTVTFNADTGEILDADIEINSADPAVTAAEPLPLSSYDLQSIITHEVGHYFGLAHTRVNGATMEARYNRGETDLRSLEADDMAGMCAIYPNEDTRTTDIPGQLVPTNVPAGPCDPTVRVEPPGEVASPTCLCATGPRPGGSSLAALLGAAALGLAGARRLARAPRG